MTNIFIFFIVPIAAGFVPPPYSTPCCRNNPEPLVSGSPDQSVRPETATKSISEASDFKKMVEEQTPIVDKTLFVKEIHNAANTLLISRPRGFGKSFNLSMLKYFYAMNETFKSLFNGFSITKEVDFCSEHQNKYPVLHVSFAGINHTTFDGCKGAFKAVARKLFLEHSYLVNSSHLNDEERKQFKAFARGKIPDSLVALPFAILPRYLHAHHGKKVIYLLDAYDTPIMNGYMHKYYGDVVELVRGILDGILKNNQDLNKAVIVGITNIGMNVGMDLVSYSIFDENFVQYFGFTDSEVNKLIIKYKVTTPGISAKIENAYSGYNMGNKTFYNPGAVTACLMKKGNLGNHWVMDGTHERFYDLVVEFGVVPTLKGEFLLSGVELTQWMRSTLDLANLATDEDMFWTFLTQLGYLTVSRQFKKKDGDLLCDLRIPNHEIQEAFDFVVYGYPHHFKVPVYSKFIEAFADETVKAATILESYLKKSGKYYPGSTPIITIVGLLRGLEPKYGQIVKVPDMDELYVFENAPILLMMRPVEKETEFRPRLTDRYMISMWNKLREHVPENRVTEQVVVSFFNYSIRLSFYHQN